MEFKFHKLILNVMTAPNPTRYTKSGKYIVQIEYGIGPKWVIRERAIDCLLPIALCKTFEKEEPHQQMSEGPGPLLKTEPI